MANDSNPPTDATESPAPFVPPDRVGFSYGLAMRITLIVTIPVAVVHFSAMKFGTELLVYTAPVAALAAWAAGVYAAWVTIDR